MSAKDNRAFDKLILLCLVRTYEIGDLPQNYPV
jgi:hypothetical protein